MMQLHMMWSIFKAFSSDSSNILSEAKSECSNLNNIVKIDSNTINYCLQYVLNEFTPISFYEGFISIITKHQLLEAIDFFTVACKNWLRHFIMKLLEVKLKVNAKLLVSLLIPPRPWGCQWWTLLHIEHYRVFHWGLW